MVDVAAAAPGALRALGDRAPRIPVRVGKPLVFLLSLVPLVVLAVEAATHTLGKNPINEAEHFTGEWALRFLIATLSVTPLRALLGWNSLAQYRRMLGLFAFFYATIHLATWTGVDMELDLGDMGHEIVKHKYITIGMFGWLLLLPLAITSTKGWIRRLGGRRWNRLHRLTYVAAVAGTIHFFWAVKKDLTDPLIFAAIFALLFAYRLWARRAPRAPAAPPRVARG
ncbi:MAG: hypothetical protein NVS1B4_18710 [Gemmatimonadaceae bacterium]